MFDGKGQPFPSYGGWPSAVEACADEPMCLVVGGWGASFLGALTDFGPMDLGVVRSSVLFCYRCRIWAVSRESMSNGVAQPTFRLACCAS